MKQSIEVLKAIARKYGSAEYSDVVFGLELVNEPISWSPNKLTKTQGWAEEAYHAVRQAAKNKDLMIVMHDSFATPHAWTDISKRLNGQASKAEAKFVIDTHLYQNQQDSDSDLDQDQHISKACNWTRSDLLPASSDLPVLVGEFSAQTNICAYPNGTETTAGSTCDVEGCQCQNIDMKYWQQPLKEAVRRFVEAQMEAFEHSSTGWFIWSYKAPGAWGLENFVAHEVLENNVTNRKYANQCGFDSAD